MALKTKIKCPLCEGEAKLIKTTTKLFNGLIVLNDEPVYECIKCKEQFVTGKMVSKTVKRAKETFKFKRQIISTGGSLGITFPPDLSEYYGLTQGTKINIIPKNKNTIEIITQKN